MTKFIRAGTPEAAKAIARLRAACTSDGQNEQCATVKVDSKPVLKKFIRNLREELHADDSPLRRCRYW
ncbi:MAG: hypothetical protein RL536_273 [Candidatus Parcubacteria bacterium]